MPMQYDKDAPAPTPIWERRLLRAAKRGDEIAETNLLNLYEPMVRRVARSFYLPGGEPEDLEQEARLGIFRAIHAWDQSRRVPFKRFAWLCAMHEAGRAVKSARAAKHVPLNAARPLHAPVSGDGVLLEDTIPAADHSDVDPPAKAIAREQLRAIVDAAPALTMLERTALALATSDRSYREIARALGVRQRAVNNALQRARGKLIQRVAA